MIVRYQIILDFKVEHLGNNLIQRISYLPSELTYLICNFFFFKSGVFLLQLAFQDLKQLICKDKKLHMKKLISF